MTRTRLPNRRASTNIDFEVGGQRYTCTYSKFADGRVAEVFLNNHRSNSGADVMARDSAIAVSFALQLGGDLETIRVAMCRDSQGAASGPLGAALDLITREEKPDDERRRLPGAVVGVHSAACVVTQTDEGLTAAIKAAGGFRSLVV